MRKKKICFVVASPMTAVSFLRDHIDALSQNYDVYLACNIKNDELVAQLNISGLYKFDIVREISFMKDLKALRQLYHYFLTENFDAVHSVTPKAGLICALASKFAHITHRTHIFTGQIWSTCSGFKRFLLMSLDKVIAFLDNHILVDGEPQRQFLIENKVISAQKSLVLGPGSISGVNISRFNPSDVIRKEVRDEINLSSNQFVFAFMGRQNHEKGVFELFQAFNDLVIKYNNLVLLLIGTDEEGCLSHLTEFENLELGKNVIYYGRTPYPEKYLQAADVFCMPSYREGFGTSVIEASCLGLPVICSDIYGLQDTMLDNLTGLRCKVKDVESLYLAMKSYVDNPILASKHGINGRERILNFFSSEYITSFWVRWYNSILS